MFGKWIKPRWVPVVVYFIGGVLPACSARAQIDNTSTMYFQDFAQASFTTTPGSLSTAFVPPTTAAFSNYLFRPKGFEAKAHPYRYHYSVAVADDMSGKCLRKLIIPEISKQRDVYETNRQGGFLERLTRASRHSLFFDSSSTGFNWSGLPASAVSAAISNLYQPSAQATWAATLRRTGTNSLGYWFSDVAWEFDLTCKARLCLKTFHLNCKHPSVR